MNALQLFVDRLSKGDSIGLSELPESFIDDCQKVLVSLGDRAGGRHDKRHSSLRHIFTEKQYVREITMKKGSIIVSRKHKTQHPFIVSKGVVTVFTPGVGINILEAPYLGVTEAGTKRLLYINEETVWTTIHVNEKEERCPDKIVVEITEVEEFEFEEPKMKEVYLQ
jgi:hypothetical protein